MQAPLRRGCFVRVLTRALWIRGKAIPLSPEVGFWLAWVLFLSRDCEEGLAQAERLAEEAASASSLCVSLACRPKLTGGE